MSEIIKRMARAICASKGRDPDAMLPRSVAIVVAYNPPRTAQQPGDPYPAWHEHRVEAKAALAAIREPTEAMIRAGLETGQFENEATATSPNAPRHVWQAMIDEAGK